MEGIQRGPGPRGSGPFARIGVFLRFIVGDTVAGPAPITRVAAFDLPRVYRTVSYRDVSSRDAGHGTNERTVSSSASATNFPSNSRRLSTIDLSRVKTRTRTRTRTRSGSSRAKEEKEIVRGANASKIEEIEHHLERFETVGKIRGIAGATVASRPLVNSRFFPFFPNRSAITTAENNDCDTLPNGSLVASFPNGSDRLTGLPSSTYRAAVCGDQSERAPVNRAPCLPFLDGVMRVRCVSIGIRDPRVNLRRLRVRPSRVFPRERLPRPTTRASGIRERGCRSRDVVFSVDESRGETTESENRT